MTGILFSISIAQLKSKTLLVVENDVGFPDIGRRDGDLGNSAVIIGVPFKIGIAPALMIQNGGGCEESREKET